LTFAYDPAVVLINSVHIPYAIVYFFLYSIKKKKKCFLKQCDFCHIVVRLMELLLHFRNRIEVLNSHPAL